MSNHTDHNDNDLNRAMQHQVGHLHGAPLTLGDVQSRAKRIQRRRRIAASVAAAAAVAIIAPIGLVITDNQPDSSGPTKHPSSTSSTPKAVDPATYEIDLTPPAEGTTGAEPGIPFWFGGGLTAVNGDTVPIAVPVENAIQDSSNGQWAGVVQDDQGNYTWTSYDSSSGAVLAASPALSDNVAVTPDGASYAYLANNAPESAADPTWQLVLGGAGARTWDLGSVAPARPGTGAIGILSDGSVVFEFESGKPMLARPDGSTEALPGTYVRARSASTATDRIAVQTSYNSDGTSCWAVVDSSGAKTAQSCDYQLGSFSADGSFVIGYDSGSDGLGAASVSILDATTLEPVTTFTMPSNGFIATQLAWSGDTILANAWHAGTWYLERLSPDGVLQQRSVGIRGDETGPVPFHFAAGPLNVSTP